jgi:hypothetical protein
MSLRVRNVVIALALFIATDMVLTHHSYSAVFDVNNKVVLTGTLTKVDWRNHGPSKHRRRHFLRDGAYQRSYSRKPLAQLSVWKRIAPRTAACSGLY